jgi:hypothetical protein
MPWYVPVQAVADRLGIEYEAAEDLARECDELGLARHHVAHSVTLDEAGRQLAKDAAKPGSSSAPNRRRAAGAPARGAGSPGKGSRR